MAEMMDGVVHILPDFQVTFAAAGQRVVEGMRQLRQFFLRRQRTAPHCLAFDDARVLAVPDALAHGEEEPFLAEVLPFIRQRLLQLPPGWPRVGGIETLRLAALAFPWCIRYMIQLPIGIDQDVSALAFEEGKHVEVAIALGGLRPEFAGDLDDRLYAKPIHFYPADTFAAMAQHITVGIAVQVFAYLAQGIERVFQFFLLAWQGRS